MNILLLTRYDRLGASSRLRFLQYLDYLAKQDVNVTVSPLLLNKYIQAIYSKQSISKVEIIISYLRRIAKLFKAKQYDLLWIEKELFPWMPAIAEHILNYLKIPYVVDYDDAVFHSYDQKPWIRCFLGKKIAAVMRKACLVTVGNDYLAGYARSAGAKQIEYLPTVIDLDRYSLGAVPVNEIPVIGWIGTPATAHYLKQIAPALTHIYQTKKAHIVAVGLNESPLAIPMELRSWLEETEVANIQTFDIGIMPLPDEPWARGKCGYKLIQYMACAKPVVASPVGVNQKIVQSGVNGFLASSQEEWITALMQLLTDKNLRETMGKAGRLRVEKKYSLQVIAPKLLNSIMSFS